MSKKKVVSKPENVTKAKHEEIPQLTVQSDRHQITGAESYDALLKFVMTKLHSEKLVQFIDCFDMELATLKSALKHSHAIFDEFPLLTAYLVWTKYCYLKIEGFDYPKIAIEKDIIPFKNSKGRLSLVKDASKDFFLDVLEAIRCRRDLSLSLKEALVYLILDFNEWFYNETGFGDRFKIEDPDRAKTKGRLVEFDDFIELLCALDKRCQLVAKLLYFGGSRTLEQVITLQIENIQFAEKEIIFDELKISYPKHVFEDILTLIDGRHSGNVFEGRQNTPLNAATIFRNFKEAASRLSFEVGFSPKSLTTNL